MKNFLCFRKKQQFTGFSQWEKKYPDGTTALVCVDDYKCTRALIRSAFFAQEKGYDFGQMFDKTSATHFGLKS